MESYFFVLTYTYHNTKIQLHKNYKDNKYLELKNHQTSKVLNISDKLDGPLIIQNLTNHYLNSKLFVISRKDVVNTELSGIHCSSRLDTVKLL